MPNTEESSHRGSHSSSYSEGSLSDLVPDSPPTSPLRESTFPSKELDEQEMFSSFDDLMSFLDKFESTVCAILVYFVLVLTYINHRDMIGIA
jgi:hypothetical protein